MVPWFQITWTKNLLMFCNQEYDRWISTQSRVNTATKFICQFSPSWFSNANVNEIFRPVDHLLFRLFYVATLGDFQKLMSSSSLHFDQEISLHYRKIFTMMWIQPRMLALFSENLHVYSKYIMVYTFIFFFFLLM